jgi:hypothetical protein
MLAEAARGRWQLDARERRGGDDHHVHGDRARLAPARAHATVRDGRLLDQGAVRDDASLGGRVDDEVDRGLVGRVVDGREPVACPVREVVAEGDPAPGGVGADDESVLRGATIGDAHAQRVAGATRQGNAERARIATERHARGAHLHVAHAHRLEQVEHERVGARGAPERDRLDDGDGVATIGERDGELVVPDVDPGSRLRASLRHQDRERCRGQSDRSHVHPMK